MTGRNPRGFTYTPECALLLFVCFFAAMFVPEIFR